MTNYNRQNQKSNVLNSESDADKLQEYRDDTYDFIEGHITNDQTNKFLKVLPGLGKSYTSLEVMKDTADNQQYFYATHLHENRKERKQEIEEETDLDVKVAPKLDTCPIFDSQSDATDDYIEEAVNTGMPPKEAHNLRKQKPGEIDKHTNGECPYTMGSFTSDDRDQMDVLIGDPLHTRAKENVEGRRVIIDESSGIKEAHTTEFGYFDKAKPVTDYIKPVITHAEHSDIDSWTEFRKRAVEADKPTDDEGIKEIIMYAISIVNDDFKISNPMEIWDDQSHPPHVNAANIINIIAMNNPEELEITGASDEELNGTCYRYKTPGGILLVKPNKDAEDGILYIERSNLQENAKSVTALDGSDKRGRWSRYYDLSTEELLSKREEQDYLNVAFEDVRLLGREGMNGPTLRPYNNDNVSPAYDRGMLHLIQAKHNTRPSVITTLNALKKYEDMSDDEVQVIPEVPSGLKNSKWTMHYGNIRSNRDFEGRDVIVVIGSNHPPEDEIIKECLIDNIEPTINSADDVETFAGDTGEVRNDLIEEETMQALMRGRRDDSSDSGSIVYVNTNTIPDNIESVCTNWEFNETLLSGHARVEAISTIRNLELGNLIPLSDGEVVDSESKKCQNIPTNTAYNNIGDICHNELTEYGLTRSMITDASNLIQQTANHIMGVFNRNGLIQKVKESAGPNPAVWEYKGVDNFLHKSEINDEKVTKTRGQHSTKEHANNNVIQESELSKMEKLNRKMMKKQREQIQQYKKEMKARSNGGGDRHDKPPEERKRPPIDEFKMKEGRY